MVNYTDLNLTDGRSQEKEKRDEDSTNSMIRDSTMASNQLKRSRKEGNDETWTEVTRNSKKRNTSLSSNDQLRPRHVANQVSVTCMKTFPRQFALAKLLKENGISGVLKVKYVNQYKLLLNFETAICAEKFMSCEVFSKMSWKRQKTSEIGVSYGLIKDIDLDITDEELIQNISSEYKIVSAKRLNRRSLDGWIPSTSFRFGFDGPTLPRYVYLYELRINVESYVFPVTQCSRCWRYGHTTKLCPANREICPKCGERHPNCETKKFKCVNCSGKHMALSKTCPKYLKEKRIRQLMSEFGCSYQNALEKFILTLPSEDGFGFVDFSSSRPDTIASMPTTPRTSLYVPKSDVSVSAHQSRSYSEALKSAQKVDASRPPKTTNKRKKKVPFHLSDSVVAMIDISSESEVTPNGNSVPNQDNTEIRQDERCERIQSSEDLLQRLKELIFSKNSLEEKIKVAVEVCMEWFLSFIRKKLTDISIFKNLFTSVNG